MNRRALVVALLLALASPIAHAQVPNHISYQGLLTDDLGNPVADGNYDLTFRLFDLSAGGVALYTETQNAVPLSKGGFSVRIGAVTTLATVPFDKPYWLEVQVGAGPPLAPRVPFGASPYANHLRLPFSGLASSGGSAFTLRNAGDGPALVTDGILEVGGSNESGILRLRRVGVLDPVIVAAASTTGGSLNSYDETGNGIWALEPDAQGAGAIMVLTRGASSTGFFYDGNSAGTEEPRLTISGDTRAIVFDSDAASGDAALALPIDAISSVETLDEPGVAANTNSTGLVLTTAVGSILSRSITVPTAGYVVAVANSEVVLAHTNGVGSTILIGLTDVAGTIPATQDVSIALHSDLPTGTYRVHGSAVAVFAVTAGTTTITYYGQELSGSASALDPTLALMFFPTAYGPVTATVPQLATSGSDDASAARAVSADPAAEREEARAFHLARLEREMARMREELDRAKAEMAAAAARQAAARR